PTLILLAPGIESGRGHFVLEERVTHPKARTIPVLLLGEAVSGFDVPVAQLADLATHLDELAPPRSTQLLAAAEVALEKARADAQAAKNAARRSEATLAEQLARVTGELDRERRAHAVTRATTEELNQKLEALTKEHAQTQDALASLSREHAEATSRRDALKEKLDAALERAQQRSEAAAALEAKAEALEAQVAAEHAARTAAETKRDALASDDQQHQAELAATTSRLEEQLGRARRQLETAREAHRIELEKRAADHEDELAALTRRHDETVTALKRAHGEALAALQVQLDGARASTVLELDEKARALDEERRAHREALDHRAAQARAEREQTLEAHRRELAAATKPLEERLTHAAEALDEARARHDAAVRAHAAELESAREQHATAMKAAETRFGEQLGALEADLDAATRALASQRAKTLEAQAAVASERAQAETAAAGVASLRAELAAKAIELEAAGAQLATARERTAQAEARLGETEERVRVLESRTHLIATVQDEAAPLAIPRTGTVAMGELARLAVQLWAARADVRIDLTIATGTRRLWLRRGALIAAWSPLRTESITMRARRDGLIDARAEAELREVHDASPASLLEELRQRGLLRRAEVEPLAQRWTEEIALEALSEAVCTYRLHDEPPGADVPVCEPKRSLPALAAQALRRALPFEAQLELLGGSQAVPRLVPSALDSDTLGFGPRERELLLSIDGESTAESLIAAVGLKDERGYQALAVAKIAGLIAVTAPGELAAAPLPAADPDSLDAKYEQIQHADYFGILGLPRSAAGPDVRAARDRLAKQFDPLRWSGHADPAVLRRAQAVLASIEEAARTLEDDRLRGEYARHLS
ncbi:MAG: hypothetical protein JNK82_18800, partial [Myxococcaceae bacterium]|nr:hypothetical protein [Myxococcaceae bacterium]